MLGRKSKSTPSLETPRVDALIRRVREKYRMEYFTACRNATDPKITREMAAQNLAMADTMRVSRAEYECHISALDLYWKSDEKTRQAMIAEMRSGPDDILRMFAQDREAELQRAESDAARQAEAKRQEAKRVSQAAAVRAEQERKALTAMGRFA